MKSFNLVQNSINIILLNIDVYCSNEGIKILLNQTLKGKLLTFNVFKYLHILF